MTLIIVLITIVVSVIAFYNKTIISQLSLKPNLVYHRFHLHRVVTHGLIHADWAHLIVNMYVLYIFGRVCENYFSIYFADKANLYFI